MCSQLQKHPAFWLNTGHFSNFLVFLGIVRFAVWNHFFGGHLGQKLVCLGYAVRIPNRYLIGNIPNMNKKSEPIPHREKVRISFVWWGKVDSNHRSDKQQIYSLSPLATREFPHIQLTSARLAGAGRRTRTPDLLITNQLLYQLSYTGNSRGTGIL